MENPKRFSVLLNPDNALEQIQLMRAFKRQLANEGVKDMSDGSDYNQAQKKIYSLYRRRANELIAEMFGYSARIEKMASRIGMDKLEKSEQQLLYQYPGMKKFVETFSTYDKFIHGTGNLKDHEKQVGKDLEAFADYIEEKSLENERAKRENAAKKGIDFYKLARTYDVPKEIFTKYAEKFLAEYGQLSSEPGETFDPNRKGPASDGKWQYCARNTYNSFDVSLERKVIKAPVKNRSAEDLIAILLGHEFTHFIQMLNQEKLPLRLFRKVCADRRNLLMEGGGMMMQGKVCEELFGYEHFPRVQYVRAMSVRQNGGSYRDCVKAYYESSLKMLQADEWFQNLPQEKKDEMTQRQIDIAIKTVKRLFASEDDFDSSHGILTSSRSTVYLEQYAAMEKFKQNNLEKYCLIRGLSLRSMADLMELGFLEISDMELPKMDFIRKSWDEIKKDYKLAA